MSASLNNVEVCMPYSQSDLRSRNCYYAQALVYTVGHVSIFYNEYQSYFILLLTIFYEETGSK